MMMQKIKEFRITLTLGTLIVFIGSIATALGVRFNTINKIDRIADSVSVLSSDVSEIKTTLTPMVMKHETTLVKITTKLEMSN